MRKDATYGQFFFNYITQKDKPHWARLVPGVNLIRFIGNESTGTSDITTAKILFNSTISTKSVQLICCDIKKLLHMDTNGKILVHPIIFDFNPRRNYSTIWTKGDITQ